MTPPASGSAPERVDDPAAAKLLTDPTYRSVLGAFLGRERSASEAALELRLGLDATLYRIRRLHRVGLLELVGERARAGRAVKRYRARHQAWFVPFEALPYADLEETFLELHVAHARRLARAAARALVRAPWAGYRIERDAEGRLSMYGVRGDGSGFGRAGGDAGVTDAMLDLRLAPEDARRLNAEIAALIERYAALHQRVGPVNRLLLVASVPVDDA